MRSIFCSCEECLYASDALRICGMRCKPFLLGKDLNTMIHQQLCRKPIAGDQSAIEKTVMDDTLAAGWAFGFQDCLFAAGFPADPERLLGAHAELSRDIVSRIVYNAILYSFARLPWRRQTAEGFRTDENGDFIWPGFGDNLRVLEWILKRCDGTANAQETPIGYVPNPEDINLEGLDIDIETLKKILVVDKDRWTAEAEEIENYYKIFGDRLPQELTDELNGLKARLAE